MNDTHEQEESTPEVPDITISETVADTPEITNGSEETSLQPAIVGIDDDISKVLLQAVNMNIDSLVHEPTCSICRSPMREDAEQKWMETSEPKDVKKIIKDHEGLSVTNEAIKHHMLFHFDRAGAEFHKIEYANRIQRMSNNYMATLDRVKMALAILDDKLMSVNALSPSKAFSQAEIEKIKGDLTVKYMSSMQQFIKLKASIENDMHKAGDVVTIPKGKFIEVFDTAIAESTNGDVKNAIYEIVKKLQHVSQGNG